MSFQKRRLFGFAVGSGMLALPALIFALWLHDVWRAGNETVLEELAKYDRLRSIAAYRPTLDTLDEGGNDSVYGGLFLKDGTVAVVSADLLTQLKQFAAMQGIEVMRAGDLQPKAEGPLTLVGGSVEMSGTVSGIYALVQQIESARPLLFIDRLDMRSNGSGGEVAASDTRLMVQIQVYGAVRSSGLPNPGAGG